jgi:outer membrane protein insertion porin family
MGRWAVGLRTAIAVPLLALLAAGCHEAGAIRVASLAFDGNDAFSDDQLASVVTTAEGGWLPWSEARYFDPDQFKTDLERLVEFYRTRGFPDARVRGAGVDLSESGDAVDLTITIDEGAPVLTADVRFTGFEVLEPGVRAALDAVPLAAGSRLDLEALGTSHDQAIELLRNHGYPHANVETLQEPAPDGSGVVVTFAADPGPRSVFGEISIAGLSTLDEEVLTRHLTFAPGELYQHREILQSQRRLGSLEILRFVHVDPRLSDAAESTEVPVVITATESPPRRLELRLGYGSEERLRGSVEWSHLNFLGDARRADFEARWSTVSRGVEAALAQPYAFVEGLSLDVSGSAWWARERIYSARTIGGRVGAAYRLDADRDLVPTRAPGDVLRVAYVYDFLAYEIPDEVRRETFDFEQLVALGLDPSTGRGEGTRAAIVASLEHQATDDLFNPQRGYGATVRLEHARPWLGGTFAYDELLVEGRAYVPMAEALVLAARMRLGTLRAERDADVPFSERYFLGGATSLRGWGRYQVAPLQQGVPIGGRTVLDASLEARFSIRGPLGGALFVDAGNVWAGGWDVRWRDLRSDVGFGLRYDTPIGLVRGDLAWQLTPIADLRIDGEPQTRRWRVHVSIGQAF